MAGWSLSSSSSSYSLNLIEVLGKLQSVGYCLDLPIYTSDANPQKLSSVFNRILTLFFEEIHRIPEIRPVPPRLGDGHAIDLFKLYWIVQERGGGRAVNGAKGGWIAVGEALGFVQVSGSCLKLVYAKYLEALERWFAKVVGKKERPLVAVLKGKKGGDGKKAVAGTKKNHFLTPGQDVGRRLEQDGGDDDEKMNGNDNGNGIGNANGDVNVNDIDVNDDKVMIIEPPKVANGEESSSCLKKRKRDELAGLLDWMLRVAKNPGDVTIARVLSLNGGKEKGQCVVGALYSQALAARRAIFLKKIQNTIMTGPKTNSSLYPGSITPDKLRYSPRLQSNRQPNLNQSSGASITLGNHVVKLSSTEDTNTSKRRHRYSCPLSDLLSHLLPKDQKQQRIPVGSMFQAQVPAWTGKVSITPYNSDDLKWLGTPIWPPENKVDEKIDMAFIGKGRQDSCKCEYPNSVECMRFHVAENRFRVKRELGSAFFLWKFDSMGEEVALAWTGEEARKFKEIVFQYPTKQNFWTQLDSCFPLKGRKNLVSYYFNVFLLARRSYQNRVTPNSIDSDDEETEFGFLSNPLGHEAMKVPAPKSILCAQNSQCVELDDYESRRML